ncbi:MAG: class I SAM-dependent DNA methyltransferase [Candidatus Woesearchaeota archaeon]
MDLEKYTKKMYDKYGGEYQKTRDEKNPKRAYNEFLELPCMVKSVGKINGKKLLDIGCGAGVHAKRYIRKGAHCYGIDISTTMINLAKKRCPEGKFKVSKMTKIPYKKSTFDIATASLCMDYAMTLEKPFKEVSRVLKKGGVFYYSYDSVFTTVRESIKFKGAKITGIGYMEYNNKITPFGDAWKEGAIRWTMVPGMEMITVHRSISKQLTALQKSGLELINIIHCKPVKEFKKYAPKGYQKFLKNPIFSIYVARKK